MPGIRSTFAGRLLAAVLVLVLLPAAILGVVLYRQARATAMDAELTRIETHVRRPRGPDRRVRAGPARYRTLRRDERRGARLHPGPRDAVAVAQVDEWLRDGPFSSDVVDDAFILDAQGTCIASTNPVVRRRVLRLPVVLPGGGHRIDAISDWTIGATSGEPGIYLASPIRGEFDEVAGVLVIKLETGAVDDLVDQAFAIGARAVILERDGRRALRLRRCLRLQHRRRPDSRGGGADHRHSPVRRRAAPLPGPHRPCGRTSTACCPGRRQSPVSTRSTA